MSEEYRCSIRAKIKNKVRIIGKVGYGTENIGGTTNYNNLENKPKINNIELKDNKTSEQLGLQGKMEKIKNSEIEEMIKNFI